MEAVLIRLKNIKFSFDKNIIFSSLSFDLPRSGYLVISGPARSGKTTLVKMITGLVMPDSGDLLIDDEPIETIASSGTRLRALRRKIGGVGGIYLLLEDRTVLENISLSAEIAGLSAKMARKNALEACARYRLNHIAGHYPSMISEVERRIAQIARSEAGVKNLIVADSPTDGLDHKSARFINDRLASRNLSGTAILYLTSGEGPKTGPHNYICLPEGEAV